MSSLFGRFRRGKSREKVVDAEALGPLPETDAQRFFYRNYTSTSASAGEERELRGMARALAEAESWADEQVREKQLEFVWETKDPSRWAGDDWAEYRDAPDCWVYATGHGLRVRDRELFTRYCDTDTPENRRVAQASLALAIKAKRELEPS